MAIKFETVKAGDKLWDVHRQKMGNTTMSETCSWPVEVISIDENGAMVRWNYNSPRRYSRRDIERLRRSPHKPRAREETK